MNSSFWRQKLKLILKAMLFRHISKNEFALFLINIYFYTYKIAVQKYVFR